MVRCNKCDWVYLTDIHVGEEEWKTYTLEKRNSIINSKIKKSSLKIEPEDMPTAIDKRKETEIEIKKTPHGWGRNSFFEDDSIAVDKPAENSVKQAATEPLPVSQYQSLNDPVSRQTFNNSGWSQTERDNDERVLSIGEWLASMFLLALPIVRIVFFILYIVSPEKYGRNRKNWAIAKLIYTLIVLVVCFIIIYIMGAAMISLFKLMIESISGGLNITYFV